MEKLPNTNEQFLVKIQWLAKKEEMLAELIADEKIGTDALVGHAIHTIKDELLDDKEIWRGNNYNDIKEKIIKKYRDILEHAKLV